MQTQSFVWHFAGQTVTANQAASLQPQFPLTSPVGFCPFHRFPFQRRSANPVRNYREAFMTDTSFTSQRVGRRKTSKTKRQPHRLLIEELEGRVVLSYFPSTTNGIHIIEDQLPSSLSNAMVQFVANHIDGTQKELLGHT